MSDAAAAISAREVVVRYGGLRAVDEFSLDVAPGERRALIGPNGAGKTTLFNVLGGQVRPTSGTVHIFGRDVTRSSSRIRVRLGVGRTFQMTNLLENLTVHENLLLASAAVTRRVRWQPVKGLAQEREVAEKTDALLSQWDLAPFRTTSVGELGYGQQRICELAVAMASEPRALLLDEPTAGVSKSEAQFVSGIIAALPKDLTILLIEHDMEVAFALADVVTVMANGKELASGTPADIQGNAQVIEAYLGAGHRVA
jgi:branched-chain amino acid transport system ATP-binding protein